MGSLLFFHNFFMLPPAPSVREHNDLYWISRHALLNIDMFSIGKLQKVPSIGNYDLNIADHTLGDGASSLVPH